jgi:hypothetical protein
VLVAALVVGVDIARERQFIRKALIDGIGIQLIDEPIVAAIRDGAVRLIDIDWLLDSRSDGQLPRVTKVVARLASNEPTSVLTRRLATHCGTSSICITVEAASAASPSPPPSPPEVAALAEVQLKDWSSLGHVTPKSTVVVSFHLSTFEEAATLTAANLRRKAEEVRDRLAQLPELERVEIVIGKSFLPHCQNMPPEAFLPPVRAADLYELRRRGVKVVSYCWRISGMPDPDGFTLEKIRGSLSEKEVMGGGDGDQGLFVDFACIPQSFAWPSWYAPEVIIGRLGAEARQGPPTVLKFERERVATEDEAQVGVDELVSLCEGEKWELASIADFESLGLSKHVSVLFHGRYVVAQSPGRLLRVCKKNLRSKRIFFFGSDRKEVVQLLLDFEDSIAVEVDRKRAKHLKLRTEDLVRARRSRYLKRFDGFAFDGSSVAPQRTSDGSSSTDIGRLPVNEEPMPTQHVSVPTRTFHVVSVELERPGSGKIETYRGKDLRAANMVDGLISTFRAALFTSRADDRDLNAQKGSSGQGVTCVSSEEFTDSEALRI